jgi:hypothetical protein
MSFFRPRNKKGKYKNRGWLANSQNESIELQRAILWELQQNNAFQARRAAIAEAELRKNTTDQQWSELKQRGFLKDVS